MADAAITVSVISHRQSELIDGLLRDLATYCAPGLTVLVTHNVPEKQLVEPREWNHRLEVVRNERPKGFGANHNAAFRRCATPLFCVVNPDIRLTTDPFPPLAATLADRRVAVAGPLVRAPDGSPEDSARVFPTALGLLRKFLLRPAGPDYPLDRGAIDVDWVAGMFMVVQADAFRSVGGFDEEFFLYYEDVDLCRRLRAAGYSVLYEPATSVIHDARRASRRNPRLMAIHAKSAIRYLTRNYG